MTKFDPEHIELILMPSPEIVRLSPWHMATLGHGEARRELGRVAGIYILEQRDTRRQYIGQSTDIIGRVRSHIERLVRGKHSNRAMTSDHASYGLERWRITSILLPADHIRRWEAFAIKLLRPYYNDNIYRLIGESPA